MSCNAVNKCTTLFKCLFWLQLSDSQRSLTLQSSGYSVAAGVATLSLKMPVVLECAQLTKCSDYT